MSNLKFKFEYVSSTTKNLISWSKLTRITGIALAGTTGCKLRIELSQTKCPGPARGNKDRCRSLSE
jgi:hypothetical protein